MELVPNLPAAPPPVNVVMPPPRTDPTRAAPARDVRFAHPSEQIFALLLDFHRIDWQYEPRTFPISWDRQGNVREAFSPDFYLPEMDLYVELTTAKQSLVRRKNRKIKLLKKLYPDINIRIFYQRDIEDLVFKMGAR
jgi:hypoxanthine phosphoribosyltransferase